MDTAPWRQFLLLAKKVRDEINDIYEALRRGFNDSRKTKTVTEEQTPTPEGAIRALSSQAKFGQDVRSILESQQAVLEKATELLSKVQGVGEKETRLFKDQAAKALKTVRGLPQRATMAPGAG